MLFLFLLCFGLGGFAWIQFAQSQKLKSSSQRLQGQVRELDTEVYALEKRYQSIIFENQRLNTQVRELDAEASALQKRYQPIISDEQAIQKLKNLIESGKEKSKTLENKIIFLQKEIMPLEEEYFFMSIGFYEPKYDFQESILYQKRLDDIRIKQKALLKGNTAVTTHTISIELSQSKEQKKERSKIIKSFTKLILRAFNGECDSCITKVKYNNIGTMESRIKKSFEALNKLVDIAGVAISQDFLKLKLEELWLVHEYQEKKQEELEEQRLIREQMKEEQKVQKEIEKALRDAEKEEEMYQRALEEARGKLAQDNGKNSVLLKQIAALEEKLHEAEANKERATSQAQLTKSGYVYVISNLGSFGENIYKIGMTRRLEPMDRVKELSNASVPFPFDVHAMIYCENAPEMESNLHKYFDDTRVNKSNRKKEFFQVSIDEIVEAVKRVDAQLKTCKSEIQFTKIAEAQEYRKTLAASLSDSD